MKKIKYILLAITVATAIILSTLSASAAGRGNRFMDRVLQEL